MDVCVVGSCVIDLGVRVPRLPTTGETLIGTTLETHVGGKGLNQAVAAALAGASTSMVATIGADDHGALVLATLDECGIDRREVSSTAAVHTGVGIPIVDSAGDNTIILLPGANGALSLDDVERAAPTLAGTSVVVIQLEVPFEVSRRAAQIARAAGATVVLNAAPMADAADELRGLVDILVVNEIEARQLLDPGRGAEDSDRKRHRRRPLAGHALARALTERWAPATVVVTLGSRGIVAASPDEDWQIDVEPVEAFDTVGAGDAVVGSLAALLTQACPVDEALHYGAAAAAIAVTRAGSASSLPARAEVELALR